MENYYMHLTRDRFIFNHAASPSVPFPFLADVCHLYPAGHARARPTARLAAQSGAAAGQLRADSVAGVRSYAGPDPGPVGKETYPLVSRRPCSAGCRLHPAAKPFAEI